MSGAAGVRQSKGAEPIAMHSGIPEKTEGRPFVGKAALLGMCPRCSGRTLFDGTVQFSDKCAACGLDYRGFNVGDGPAGFLTLIIGALIVGLAIWLDVAVRPPLWVHAMIWIPVTSMAVIFGLRVAKALLLYAEFDRRAGEAGRKP